MVTIDGSLGEGGGQIVRSAVALSLVTGRACTIENIRAGRKKRGLGHQHLTAVAAAAEISQAQVEGAAIGSSRLVFRPGQVRPGDYEFRVGTAGSTTLVLQTVLPALLIAPGPSRLMLEGGTHNPFAPPFDFLAKTYLPLLNRLGPRVEAALDRPGFYPAGGGQIRVEIQPAGRLGRLELIHRGPMTACRVRAMVANLPRHIAQRECRTIAEETGWDEACFCVEEIRAARGPGNAVTIELEFPEITEVFTGFGQRGVPAEDVARQTLHAAQRYLAAAVPVGPHLADQWLLPLGVGAQQGSGGGTYRTLRLSQHATTHLAVLREFMQLNIQVEDLGGDECLVTILP